MWSNLGVFIQNDQTFFQGIWIYFLITILVMVEGPVTILVAAGISETGNLHLLPVFFAATAGNLLADLLWYTLGYFSHLDWLLRLPKFLKLDAQKIERVKNVVDSHAVKLLLFAKITNGLIVPVLIATGMARVSMRRWLPVIVITNLLTSVVFLALGYYMTSSLRQIQQGFRYFTIFMMLALVLGMSFILPRWLGRRDLLTELEKQKECSKSE